MTRKSNRRVAEHADQLQGLGVNARSISKDERAQISQEWLERFCPNVKRNTGDWIFDGYRWHAYSFGHEKALQGDEASDALALELIQPVYIYFEFHDIMFDCVVSAWPDVQSLSDDVYLFPHSMKWTFITTHEMTMNLGPYFAIPPQ